MFAPRNDPGAAGYAGAFPVAPDYDPEHALSSIAAFPPILACARVRAADLAGLPLVVVRQTGALEDIQRDHPALRLLRRPSPTCSGLRFRRQSYVDFSTTGNAYHERPSPNLIYRMHPGLTRAVVDSVTGWERGWTYGTRTLPLGNVIPVRDSSWTTQLSMVYGESPIRCLERPLAAVTAAQDTMAAQAKRGRPEVVFSSANPGEVLGADAVRRITSAWNEFTRRQEGAFVSGYGVKADFLNLSPREMEFASAEERAIALALMVMECPPARVFWGGGSAYGTDRQAMRTYWEGLLKGMGALFADEWTHHLIGDSGAADALRIEHDASSVEALAVNRTEALSRVEKWVSALGGDPLAAARYEGFRGAPVGTPTGKITRPIDHAANEPQDDRIRLALGELEGARPDATAAIGRYLAGAAERYQRRILAADGAPERLGARDEEAVRCLVELERLGVPLDDAAEWAADIATQTDEAVYQVATQAWARGVTRVGICSLAAFSEDRAAALGRGIERNLAAGGS